MQPNEDRTGPGGNTTRPSATRRAPDAEPPGIPATPHTVPPLSPGEGVTEEQIEESGLDDEGK